LYQALHFIYTEYPTLNNQQRSNTMADTPTKVIVNCETGITEVLPLTAAEIADLETARVAAEDQRKAAEAEAAAVAAAKESANAKLAALGLSADEIAALTK
jgi:hypothetical protein